jgi:hypothetical protein
MNKSAVAEESYRMAPKFRTNLDTPSNFATKLPFSLA